MGRRKILRAITAFAVLAALPICVLGEDIAQSKQMAVRAALEKQGKTGDSVTSLIDASARAAAIADINVTGTVGAPEVTILTEGHPIYTWFKLDGGKRVVVDFHNAIHLKSGLKLAPIGLSPLLRVRSSLFALSPDFVTRVVVDLYRPAQPEFSEEDGRVTMRLRESAANIVTGSLSDKAMQAASELEQAKQQIELRCQRITETIERAKLPDTPGDAASDAIAVFVADASKRDRETLERVNRVADSAHKPLERQRSRIDELQAALLANSIETEKAQTVIQSIGQEISNARGEAERQFAIIEKGLAQTCEKRAVKYGTLMDGAASAQAKAAEAKRIELAKAEETTDTRTEMVVVGPIAIEAPPGPDAKVSEQRPVAGVATEDAAVESKPVAIEHSAVADGAVKDRRQVERDAPAAASDGPNTLKDRPDQANEASDSKGKEAVETTIAKIERDLASLKPAKQNSPAATAEDAAPAAVTKESPISAPADANPAHADTAPADAPAEGAQFAASIRTAAPAVDRKPNTGDVLAKLDGLATDMAALDAKIARVAAPAADNLQATTAVALSLVPVPQTVDAAPVDTAAASNASNPLVIAAAEQSPEPQTSAEPAPAGSAQEEVPAADKDAAEEPATPATGTGSSPAPAAESANPPAAEPTTETPAVVEQPAEPPKIIATATPAEREPLPPGVDPLDQIVNIDFREMDLSSVVSLLAKKGQVNVIAGTDVTGTVTADIRNVPLRKAMDMVLRMNGLGIVEEEGIFRIVPYEEAVAARRTTTMVPLNNAQADDVRTTLEGILVGGRDAKLVTVSSNKTTNVIIISGPEDRVAEMVRLTKELDITKPTLPTVTEAIKLNYLDPTAAKPIAETLKTEKIGKVEIDKEGRHVVVTDVPAAVEQMKTLLASVDKPVKQVAIEAMIVDAVLRDASQTGVDWTLDAIRRHSSNGDLISDVSKATLDANLGNIGSDALDAGILQLGILSSDVRLNATIAAEVQSRNAQILASPSIVTVENQPATISIVQEFPYQEITQGLTGPPVASTEFKPIGVTLDVTPRITHTNDTIVDIEAKQSSVSGLTETGVPIEDKREAHTTLRAQDGRTIFIGGLRNTSNNLNVSKIPVLGDIPVLNFLFRNTNAEKVNTELLIFLTCHVMDQELPELTATQQGAFDRLDATPKIPDGQRANFHDIVRPQDMRDPMWKWRRSNR